MEHWLVLCAACTRHIKNGESCPFCGSAEHIDHQPSELSARAYRAAMIGLGAALGIASAACTAPPYGVADAGTHHLSGADPTAPSGTTPTPPEATPPEDAH